LRIRSKLCTSIFGRFLERLALQEAVNALGGDGAVADRGGQQMRADHVAAAEHARLAGDLVVLVGGHRALAVVQHFQAGEVHRLADRRDDQVGFDVLLGAGQHLQVEPAADHLRFALRHAQRGGAAVGAAQHGHRGPAAADHDAFAQRVLHLVPAGLHLLDREDRGQRHLGALAARDQRRVVCGVAGDGHLRPVGLVHLVDMAQAARHGGDVDRGVAAADHHHALAHMLHAAVVEGLQEGGGGDDVGRPGALHRQRAAALCTHAQEDRVELLADLLERDVAADARVHARRDTEVQDALDLGVEHARGVRKPGMP
jgi:hypothetical protein